MGYSCGYRGQMRSAILANCFFAFDRVSGMSVQSAIHEARYPKWDQVVELLHSCFGTHFPMIRYFTYDMGIPNWQFTCCSC